MSTNAVGQGGACDGARELRRGWHALVALIAVGTVACGESNTSGLPVAGSLSVTTETSGFQQDDSYELFVNGESKGTIGANDEMTISDLDPATYDVALGDVAANCAVQDVSVPVVSEETASVVLTIACTFSDPDSYTLRVLRDRPDLDTGALTDCLFGICSSTDDWDLHVSSSYVIVQNQTNAVEIAHLPGVVFEDLTEADVASATFTTGPVNDPFDSGRVILIRTDLGNVYALGNPVVDSTAGTLTFDAAWISGP